MRLSFLIIVLVIPFLTRSQNARIRTDEFYQTVSDIDKAENDTTWGYLRFYPDGKVINVTSTGAANDLKKWFNLNMENASTGNYEICGKQVYFSTTSKQGTVIYHGKMIDQYQLLIKLKSLINGYRHREKYYFVAIPDLK